jgi:excisionase family DNA binding protein
MSEQNNLLAEALAAILTPIVKAAVREAINLHVGGTMQAGTAEKSFLTVKQASETSSLGVSTIRLYIRRRQLRAQQVGRRLLIKRGDLENFLESRPIRAIQDDDTIVKTGRFDGI